MWDLCLMRQLCFCRGIVLLWSYVVVKLRVGLYWGGGGGCQVDD